MSNLFQLILEPLIGPPPDPLTDEEIFVRASKAYRARCSRNGCIFNHPQKGLSEVDGDIIVLRSRKGVVAKYRWTYKGLRFVKDSDSEDPTHA